MNHAIHPINLTLKAQFHRWQSALHFLKIVMIVDIVIEIEIVVEVGFVLAVSRRCASPNRDKSVGRLAPKFKCSFNLIHADHVLFGLFYQKQSLSYTDLRERIKYRVYLFDLHQGYAHWNSLIGNCVCEVVLIQVDNHFFARATEP